MAKVLGYNLDLTKKTYLANMTLHQGYPVVKELMDEMCDLATQDVIKLDPMDGESEAAYTAKLARLQIMARATHSVCSSLLKSIEMHTVAAAQANKAEEKGISNLLDKVRQQELQEQ